MSYGSFQAGSREPKGHKVMSSDLRFHSKGLIPAIIQEADSRRILMLGYMDEAAVRRTLDTSEVWFWSRSRQEYWHKGESSGNVYKVQAVLTDCDRDALLILVREANQHTLTCHTKRVSCFAWEIINEATGFTIRELKESRTGYVHEALQGNLLEFRRLAARLCPRCSWESTRTHDSLWYDTVEEACEVADAITSRDRNALIEELGDLLYQVILHCELANLKGEFSLSDVVARLTRKLILKPEHIKVLEKDPLDPDGRPMPELADIQLAYETEQGASGDAGEARRKLEGIPSRLAALELCQKLLRRAWRYRVAEPPSSQQAAAGLQTAAEVVAGNPTKETLAQLLMAVATLAQLHGLQAERALRENCASLKDRLLSRAT